jgi:hypothetical protein
MFGDANPMQKNIGSSRGWGSGRPEIKIATSGSSTGNPANSSPWVLESTREPFFKQHSLRFGAQGAFRGTPGRSLIPTGLGWSFDSSAVFNPSPTVIVPDSKLGSAFVVGKTSSLEGVATFMIQSFDLEHFTPVASVNVSGVTGNPCD